MYTGFYSFNINLNNIFFINIYENIYAHFIFSLYIQRSCMVEHDFCFTLTSQKISNPQHDFDQNNFSPLKLVQIRQIPEADIHRVLLSNYFTKMILISLPLC